MSQLIIDGSVFEVNPELALTVMPELEEAPQGDVLVALSTPSAVVVRWITADAMMTVSEALLAPVGHGSKPLSRESCPWLYDSVEQQFESVAVEQAECLARIHAATRDSMVERGKRPQSYRRWLLKLKKRWVRSIVSEGKRVDDLGTLASSS